MQQGSGEGDPSKTDPDDFIVNLPDFSDLSPGQIVGSEPVDPAAEAALREASAVVLNRIRNSGVGTMGFLVGDDGVRRYLDGGD
ncbi:MAG TPA: hypothetical protein VLI54_01110 [Bacillota bacterium]|nr:hypothetical protein [Bacillota bacterium]